MTTHTSSGTMFHRRLALLAGVMVVTALLLSGQMARLSLVQGAQRRADAQRCLDLVHYLPTRRGSIFDRRGRALAVDRPSYDVAVDYEVITGAWAMDRAAAAARRANRAGWDEMTAAQRDQAAAAYLPAYRAGIEALWSAMTETGGIDRPELDRRLDAIKQHVQRMAAAVWQRQLQEAASASPGQPDTDFHPQPIREQRQAHVVLPRVPDRVAFAFRRLAGELPGVHVRDSQRREYPWTSADVVLDRGSLPRPARGDGKVTIHVVGVADHVLGRIRDEVWADDVDRRPFKDAATGRIVDLGGYLVGDGVGSRGVELAFEDHLRGLRGLLRRRLDTGKIRREPHVPGRDLQLSLDVALQARVQAIMAPEYGLAVASQWQAGWYADGTPRPTLLPLGTPLDGAAVVMDVDSGEILAMVSMPTEAMGREAPAACRDDDQPWLNRCVEAAYPPGSIAKSIVLAAAVVEGLHDLDSPITCNGHYLPERDDVARCWCYRPPAYHTHGPLTAADAIAHSCNIYFYELGSRLGMARLAQWYRRFGVGSPPGTGLLGENPGTLPGEDQIESLRSSGELRFASIIMGTGQGPVTWTPVHAAAAYAMLARGGVPIRPTLIRDGAQPPQQRQAVPLDDRLVATILKGLRASVSAPYGTGHHITYPDGATEPIINAAGVTVWAKTGTAQATPRSFDIDCDGQADVQIEDPSHAWFVGLVGPGRADEARPRYAVSVIIEYGGSGGRTAGPIANQIIRALQAEGYLGGEGGAS